MSVKVSYRILRQPFARGRMRPMKLFITVIGLVFILEGMPYVVFPEAMQRWMEQIRQQSPGALRGMGLVAIVVGLLLCYITQRTDLIP